jgi:hypothetical protein
MYTNLWFHLYFSRTITNCCDAYGEAHKENWQLQRNHNFWELLSARAEQMLLNGAAQIEEKQSNSRNDRETQLPGNGAWQSSHSCVAVWFPSFKCSVRARAHQGNWQLQRNLNFREKSPISSRQLVSRLAGEHWGNLCLSSCPHLLKWVCSSDTMYDYFSISCTYLLQWKIIILILSYNGGSGDPLRRCEKRRRES